MQKTITFSQEKFRREIAFISIMWIALIAISIPMAISLFNSIWATNNITIFAKLAPTIVALFALLYCLFVPLYYIMCTFQYRGHDRYVVITYDEDNKIVKYCKRSCDSEIVFFISDITIIEQHMSKWGPYYYCIMLNNETKIIVTSLMDGINDFIRQYKKQCQDQNEAFLTRWGIHLP